MRQNGVHHADPPTGQDDAETQLKRRLIAFWQPDIEESEAQRGSEHI